MAQLATDLLLADGVPKTSKSKRKDEDWAPLFLAHNFVKLNKNIQTENYMMTDDELIEKGEQVSNEREKLQ